MASETFAERINFGIRAHGLIPLTTAYRRDYVREARMLNGEVQVRLNSKWYWLTAPQRERIDRMLRSKGI